MSTAFILRTGTSWLERCVEVIFDEDVRRFFVDPRTEVTFMTGTEYDRYHCVRSFAHGLALARYRVILCEKFTDRPEQRILYTRNGNHSSVPIYAFFGMAWGMGAWQRLKTTMHRSIASKRRRAIYEQTAKHFFFTPLLDGSDIRWIL